MARRQARRKAKYPPDGAVPQTKRTPEEQLAYLDKNNFVAKKERAKLQRRIEAKVKASPEKDGKKS